jgi:hypothetical protein
MDEIPTRPECQHRTGGGVRGSVHALGASPQGIQPSAEAGGNPERHSVTDFMHGITRERGAQAVVFEAAVDTRFLGHRCSHEG